MKHILILFAFICLAFAQDNLFLPKLETDQFVVPTGNATLADLTDYYNGQWGYFKLTQTQASKCFNKDATADQYFQLLFADYNLAGAFAQGNHAAVDTYAAQIVALNATLYPNLECVENTADYQNLLTAAGFNTSNMTLLKLLDNIYYQAHFPDWYLADAPVFHLLNQNKYNQAGYSYGPILQTIAKNESINNVHFEAFKAFQNGIFYWTNLTAPYQLALCYNESQAQIAIEFYYLWSQTVANTTPSNAGNATNAYLAGEGGQLLQQIGPLNDCFEKTQDQVRLNTKIGYDVHSQVFDQAFQNYWTNDSQVFWSMMIQMYANFKDNNPEASGMFFGQIYLNVAATIHNTIIQ